MTQQQLAHQPTPQPTPPTPKWQNETIGLGSVGLRKPRAGSAPEPEEALTGVDQLTAQYGREGYKYGEHAGVERESETVYDDAGRPIGTESTTTRTASKGTLREQETEVRGSGPLGMVATKKTEVNTLRGAEAQLMSLTKVSDQELRAAVEMLARAGAFGSAAAEATLQRGSKTLTGRAEGSGGIGIQGEASGSAYLDRSGRLPQIAAAIEASIKAGVWAEGSVTATAKAHPFAFMGPLAFNIAAKVEAFAGAQASFKAAVFANAADGIGASLDASAMAGAQASAEGSASLDLGPLGIDVSAEVAAFAGVSAEFAGGFRISLSGVQAKFEASSFAGAKASISGSAGIRIRGRKLVSVKGEVEVFAGVGVKVKGEFEAGGDWSRTQKGGGAGKYASSKREKEAYGASEARAPFEVDKNGTMKLGAALGGALGIGAAIDFEAEVDFAGIADAVLMGITELGRSSDKVANDRLGPDFSRTDLAAESAMGKRMFSKGYDAVFETLQDYARSKSTTGTKNNVKRDKVQNLLDTINPTVRPYFAYKETDQGMTQAATDAFEGQVKKVELQAGQIKTWEEFSQAEIDQFKADKTHEESLRKVRDALRNALAEYGSKKERQGDNGIKKDKVQAIVNKHWPKVIAVLSPTPAPSTPAAAVVAEAQEFVKYAAQLSRIGAYFDSGFLTVSATGQLLEAPTTTALGGLGPTPAPGATGATGATAPAPLSKADLLKEQYQTASKNEKMLADFNNLESALRTYAASAATGKPFTDVEIKKIVAKHYSRMVATCGGSGPALAGLDATVTLLINKGLGDLITLSGVAGGIPAFTIEATKVEASRKAVTTSATQRAVIDAVAARLSKESAAPSSGFFSRMFGSSSAPAPTTILSNATLTTAVTTALAGATLTEAEIASCLTTALAPVAAVVTYTAQAGVRITNRPAVEQAVQDRRSGKKSNDAELDNVRRAQVMDIIREPLEKYRAEHTKAFLKATGATPPTAAPEVDEARLQAIISKVDKIKGEVGGVADATIVEALLRSFPSLDPTTTVVGLQLTLKKKTTAGTDDEATAAITRDIQRLVIMARDKKSLQIIVDRYRTRFTSTGTDLDTKIRGAIEAGFAAPAPGSTAPGVIEKIIVTKGEIKDFKLKGK